MIITTRDMTMKRKEKGGKDWKDARYRYCYGA
jgi:hypothetical protein